MKDNCSTRLYSSTSVIKRKTLRSVVFILLIIFLKSMLNPTIIVICFLFFSLFAYITYLMLILRQNIIKSIYVRFWKIFLNVVFRLLKFLIEFGLNPALTVVCLFIYIFSLFAYITYLMLIWR